LEEPATFFIQFGHVLDHRHVGMRMFLVAQFVKKVLLMDTSQYNRRVERTLDKFSSRGEQGRSPLKYTNCRLCISLERKVCPLEESLGFHKCCKQVFHHWTNSWCQNSQKVLSCKCFGGHCLLAVGLLCEGRANKLLLSTIQIARILCPLNQWL
jgi:hypothetical protein